MSATLPPGVTIAKPPPELELDDEDDDRRLGYRRPYYDDDDRRSPDALQAATAFPERIEAGLPEALAAKLFGCSGSLDSARYLEATRFRTMANMGWEEARVALNRLLVEVAGYGRRKTTREYVALAEFALTAVACEPFTGRKGDNAVKLRKELDDAIGRLQRHLGSVLRTSADNTRVLARPITDRLHGENWRSNVVLWTKVPTAADSWTRIIAATSEQAMASLDFLRATLATWDARRPFAAGVSERMASKTGAPTAAEYAEAIHIADMLAFASAKLVSLYAGIMHSMPIYRMHPATSEREAIELWWPWGRPVPLVDGGPAKAPPPRKAMLDPSIITATRPTDVVKQVIEQTGMNRTTAQRLTANLRSGLRQERKNRVEAMLREGATRAAVAKAAGLSASRISALFKGQTFPTKKRDGRHTAQRR
jgi:hypothetical protein